MRLIGAACICLASQAHSGGLDATGQSVGFLFAEGTVVEIGLGHITSALSGRDAAFLGGRRTGDIGVDTPLAFASFKHDISERASIGVLLEEPFRGSVSFGPSSIAFGGTRADARTASLTALLRYKLTDRFSIYGGPRLQWARAKFELNGAVYGPFSGYSAVLDSEMAAGYVLGVAYEIPEYFLRVALTYSSAIEHSFATTETLGATRTRSDVSSSTPQSVNLEFSSGIAPSTFVFGGVRWAEWSALQIAPPLLSAASPDPLVDFKDTVTYTLGIGRQFSETWTGTMALLVEPSTSKRTTPLTPTDGFRGISLGAVYSRGQTQLHFSLAHTELGDATPFVSALGQTVSSYSGNSSTQIGVKLVHRF